MIDAKNKFRQGFIMLNRPFKFSGVSSPLQKMTILWAYAETPVVESVLNNKAKEELELIDNSSWGPMFMSREEKEETIEKLKNKIIKEVNNYDKIYHGEIVQVIYEGITCRFFPDEYTIVDQEKLNELLQEEGYHTILNPSLLTIKEFKDRTHYLQSRGLSKSVADKWASMTFRDLVIYKPYYQLLTMFCRPWEMYADEFYEKVEGITIKDVAAPTRNFIF